MTKDEFLGKWPSTHAYLHWVEFKKDLDALLAEERSKALEEARLIARDGWINSPLGYGDCSCRMMGVEHKILVLKNSALAKGEK